MTDWIIAIGTMIAALAAICAAIYTKRAAEAAARAATEAGNQVRVMVNQQRPWLLVSLPENASQLVSQFVPSQTTLQLLYLNPVVRNYGNTTAKITLSKAKLLVLPGGQQLPADPDYNASDFYTLSGTTLLPPDTPAQGLQPGISNFDFLAVYNRTATLWLYGFIDYFDINDINESPHQSRFCFEYRVPGGFNPNPASFYISGPDAYRRCT
jgi:hypothetical protein